MKNNLPKVVIVGRANVGKSSLFNRLTDSSKAIVSTLIGTTRDRNIATANWQGKEFSLTDTGGLDIDRSDNPIEEQTVKQAIIGIKDADIILFVVDARSGLLPSDKEIAKDLLKMKLKKKVILVANKADSIKIRQGAQSEFYKLGFNEPVFVSAANGSGCGDLLDIITENFSQTPEKKEQKRLKLAIVGKPNVGKSSLLNSILGQERVIVSAIPHTTRESHDIEFEFENKKYILIDTAGIRKRSKINPKGLEKKSIDKSLDALKYCDIAVFVTEADKKIDNQDKKITQAILERSKPVIVVANKWDLIEKKDSSTINSFVEYYRAQFPYLWWAPIIFVSAKENMRSKKILEITSEIEKSMNMEIPEALLEKLLKTKIKQHKPSRGKGLKNPFIYKIVQEKTNPPRFAIFVNDPTILHFSYIRYLQNSIREEFKIIGTPIQIEVKKWKSATKTKSKK